MSRCAQSCSVFSTFVFFLGAVTFMVLIALMLIYLTVSSMWKLWHVFVENEEESKPSFIDALSPSDRLFVAVTLVFGVVTIIVFKRVNLCIWPKIGRRGYMIVQRDTSELPSLFMLQEVAEVQSPSFITVSKFNVFLYKWWSKYICDFFHHQLIFEDEASHEDKIKHHFPSDRNYLVLSNSCAISRLAVWASFSCRPTLVTQSSKGNDTPMRRFLEKYVVYGLDFTENAPLNGSPEESPRRLHLTLHTANMNFIIPVWREFLLYIGFRSISKCSLMNCLSNTKEDICTTIGKGSPPRRICVVSNGSVEDIDNLLIHTLKNSRSFIRLAVKTGSSVVPICTFGEAWMYKRHDVNHLSKRKPPQVAQAELKSLWIFQIVLQKTFELGLSFVRCLDVFKYTLGLLYHRERLITVVGKPILVRNISQGNIDFDQEVDRVHKLYNERLSTLYETLSPKYNPEVILKRKKNM
eukprot:Tbor_TRINITY_DN4946_c0_g1::TRINITY_DN4946_c0_g1_i1::g.9859::m.9859/K14457/MOGAT2, MGAT2; 2-acylglycerol O-acyltransferase 2